MLQREEREVGRVDGACQAAQRPEECDAEECPVSAGTGGKCGELPQPGIDEGIGGRDPGKRQDLFQLLGCLDEVLAVAHVISVPAWLGDLAEGDAAGEPVGGLCPPVVQRLHRAGGVEARALEAERENAREEDVRVRQDVGAELGGRARARLVAEAENGYPVRLLPPERGKGALVRCHARVSAVTLSASC